MMGVPEVQFRVHIVSAFGIIPLPEKVAAIRAFPRPGTIGQLMSFLGMVNFYRRFIKGAAGVLKPLTDALRGASGKAAKLEWSAPMLEAFEGSKKQMVQATHLARLRKKARLALSIDTSGTNVGVAQQQEVSPGSLQPLGFFSRKLNTAEQKYSAFDRELLAVYAAIRHFKWAIKEDASTCSQTTSRSPSPCTGSLMSGQHVSSITSPTWLSTHQTCSWKGECVG